MVWEKGDMARFWAAGPRSVNQKMRDETSSEGTAPIRVIDTSVESAIFFWGVRALSVPEFEIQTDFGRFLAHLKLDPSTAAFARPVPS